MTMMKDLGVFKILHYKGPSISTDLLDEQVGNYG